MKKLFKIAGELSKKQQFIIELSGFISIIFVWWLITHPFLKPRIEFNAFNGEAPYSFELLDSTNKAIESGKGNIFSIPAVGDYTLRVRDSQKHTTELKFTANTENNTKKFNSIPTDNSLGLEIQFFNRKPWINKGILPAPMAVLRSFGELSAGKININLSSKYRLTDNVYQSLEKDSIPYSVISALKTLNNKDFSNQKKLDKALQTMLSPADFLKYKYDIAKQAQVNTILSVSSLLFNTLYSLTLNILGYLEAIFLSIVVGFVISLVPFFRGLLSRYIDAIRFVPLAAVTGLFIAWFGIELNMKVQFLAFGIFVFLLPVVVQRIDEVEKVYKQTAFTLGASDWQTIRYVYWPHVLSRLIDDVRVLTAISWTYIIVAETVNKENGIGALIFTARRHSRLDQVFALLILIIIIGLIQDLVFVRIDRKINPHKY